MNAQGLMAAAGPGLGALGACVLKPRRAEKLGTLWNRFADDETESSTTFPLVAELYLLGSPEQRAFPTWPKQCVLNAQSSCIGVGGIYIVLLGIGSRALPMLSRCYITELHP